MKEIYDDDEDTIMYKIYHFATKKETKILAKSISDALKKLGWEEKDCYIRAVGLD